MTLPADLDMSATFPAMTVGRCKDRNCRKSVFEKDGILSLLFFR